MNQFNLRSGQGFARVKNRAGRRRIQKLVNTGPGIIIGKCSVYGGATLLEGQVVFARDGEDHVNFDVLEWLWGSDLEFGICITNVADEDHLIIHADVDQFARQVGLFAAANDMRADTFEFETVGASGE